MRRLPNGMSSGRHSFVWQAQFCALLAEADFGSRVFDVDADRSRDRNVLLDARH